MNLKVRQQRTIFYVQDLNDDHVLEAFQWFEGWVSRRMLAEHFGRKVSPTFVARIERLTGEGKLERFKQDLPNGQIMFWYRRTK